MAKVKFGAQITNMSGKIGGQVYSHNAAGSYVRNIGTIAVSPSPSIIASQIRFASVVAAWKTLTESQRIAWNAATVNFLRLNVFADVYTLNGFNLFCSVNTTRLVIGESILNFPPYPEQPPIIENPIIQIISPGPAFEINAGAATIPADTKWLIEATPPISPTKNNYKVNLALITVLPSGTLIPYDLTADYTAKYGAGTPTMRGGFRVTPIHTPSATKGQGQYLNYLFT